MRAREEREARRAKMDGRHEFILSTVADNVSMSLEEAEDFMLDGTQVWQANNFTNSSFFFLSLTIFLASLIKVEGSHSSFSISPQKMEVVSTFLT